MRGRVKGTSKASSSRLPRREPSPDSSEDDRFVSQEAAERFQAFLTKKRRQPCPEKGFQIDLDAWPQFGNEIRRRGWEAFCRHPGPAYVNVVREYYANMPKLTRGTARVRGHSVTIGPYTINGYYGLPNIQDHEFQNLLDYYRTQSDWVAIAKPLCRKRIIKWISYHVSLHSRCMTYAARVWLHFVNAKFIPGANRTEVTKDRALVLYAILHGIDINVGEYMASSINVTAYVGNTGLYYPSMISELCLIQGVGVPLEEQVLQPNPPITEHTLRAIPEDSESDSDADADMPDALALPPPPPATPDVPLQPEPTIPPPRAATVDQFAAMLAQLELMSTNIQGMRDDIGGIRTNVNILRDDIRGIRADVNTLRGETAYLRAWTNNFDSNLRRVAGAVDVDPSELVGTPHMGYFAPQDPAPPDAAP